MKLKNIKAAWQCKFNQDCKACSMRTLCINASNLSREARYHFLYVKGERFPANEAMLAGTKRHEEYLKDIPTIEKYGLEEFKNNLRKEKEITLSETALCNPVVGGRGIIDKLNIHLHEGILDMHATELKSGWYKGYLFQAGFYAMMLNHPATRLIVKETKKSGKEIRKSYPMWPKSQFTQNISFSIQLFHSLKPFTIQYMENNMLTDWARGLKAAITNKMSTFRSYHKYGIYHLSEIPICKNCNEHCGYHPTCSKAWPTNNKTERQLYLGKNFSTNGNLIKTKPKIAKKK